MAINLSHILGNASNIFDKQYTDAAGVSLGLTGITGPTGITGRQFMGFSVQVETKFNIKDLIKQLQEFKAAHVEDYKKAVEVYNNDLVNRLKEINKDVNKQIGNITKGEGYKSINLHINLSEPVNCEKEYDKLINFLEHVAEETIALEFNDANAILNDEWGNLAHAKLLNSTYSTRAR